MENLLVSFFRPLKKHTIDTHCTQFILHLCLIFIIYSFCCWYARNLVFYLKEMMQSVPDANASEVWLQRANAAPLSNRQWDSEFFSFLRCSWCFVALRNFSISLWGGLYWRVNSRPIIENSKWAVHTVSMGEWIGGHTATGWLKGSPHADALVDSGCLWGMGRKEQIGHDMFVVGHMQTKRACYSHHKVSRRAPVSVCDHWQGLQVNMSPFFRSHR